MQLTRSLDCGMLVISALVADLRPFFVDSSQATRLSFRRKTQLVWDDRTFKDHRDRIRDQVNSMNLLICFAAVRYYSAGYAEPGMARKVELTRYRDGLAVRRQRLLEGQQTFQRSDESAYALVLPSASSH